jgi:hypothetical protein
MQLDRNEVPATALALATGVVMFVSACGGSPARPTPLESKAELAWIENAEGLIVQLSDGVAASAAGGADIATARHVLYDQSDLFVMLMANVAFESCADSLRNAGVADARLRSAQQTLAAACRLLRQSSTLFTRAVNRSDPRELISASATARRGGRLLEDARAKLGELRAELEG